MGGERFDHWIQREKERDIHRDRKTYTHRHRQTDTHAHTNTHTHTHTHNHTHTHRQSRSHASPSGRTGSRGYIHRGGQEPRRRGRESSRQNGKKQNTCGGSRGRRGQRGGRVSVGRSLCSASSRHRRIHVAKRPDEVMCVSTRMYVRACIRTYTHTCTRHACIHTFKHTHTHTNIFKVRVPGGNQAESSANCSPRGPRGRRPSNRVPDLQFFIQRRRIPPGPRLPLVK